MVFTETMDSDFSFLLSFWSLIALPGVGFPCVLFSLLLPRLLCKCHQFHHDIRHVSIVMYWSIPVSANIPTQGVLIGRFNIFFSTSSNISSSFYRSLFSIIVHGSHL